MAVMTMMTVDLNDDEAERRKRRLKTNIGSLLSPGCHTPKLSQARHIIRYINCTGYTEALKLHVQVFVIDSYSVNCECNCLR